MVQAKQALKYSPWEELQAIEKVLIHTAHDPTQKTAFAQLTELLSYGMIVYHILMALNNLKNSFLYLGKLSVRDILGLAILCYSLIGSKVFSSHDEKQFGTALVDTLLHTPQVK